MNIVLIILSFLFLNICPAFSVNAVPAKLMMMGALLLLVEWGNVMLKINTVGKLFLAWLAWAAIGCLMSQWPWHSIPGYFGRTEGLLTYVLLTIFAITYWNHSKSFTPLIIAMGILGVAMPLLSTQLTKETFGWLCSPAVAQSVLFAVGTAVVYSINRSFVVFTLPGLVNAGMRSGLIGALAGIAAYELLSCKPKLIVESMKSVILAVFILFLVIAGILHFTHLGQKLKATAFDFTGSRSQWYLQAINEASHMPLFGYGLDTGAETLKPATGRTVDAGATADRTHNILMDMLLFTGWPGMFLVISIFVYAFFVTWENRSPINLSCFAGLTAFVVCGFLNPPGLPGICLALVCVFGFKNNKMPQ